MYLTRTYLKISRTSSCKHIIIKSGDLCHNRERELLLGLYFYTDFGGLVKPCGWLGVPGDRAFGDGSMHPRTRSSCEHAGKAESNAPLCDRRVTRHPTWGGSRGRGEALAADSRRHARTHASQPAGRRGASIPARPGPARRLGGGVGP